MKFICTLVHCFHAMKNVEFDREALLLFEGDAVLLVKFCEIIPGVVFSIFVRRLFSIFSIHVRVIIH